MLKQLALKIGGVFAAITLIMGSEASAIPINGTITFHQPSTLPGTVVEAPANQFNINFPSPMTVASPPTGDYALAGITTGNVATFSNFSILGPESSPTVLGGSALIWSIAGFTFTLQNPSLAITVVYAGSTIESFSINGRGVATGPAGYDPTVGIFSLSGTGAGGLNFTFQASETAIGRAVPDGGTTALLLGLGLVSVGYLARRKGLLA